MDLILKLLEIIGSLYITVVLLRFLLQVCRADFYNPISQFVVKATNPLLIPLRRVIPSVAGLDIAALVLAFLLQVALIYLLYPVLLQTFPANLLDVTGLSFKKLIMLLVQLYTFAIIIIVLISWVNPGAYHPGAQILYQITEPVLAPIRRVLPPMGGLDLSPMVLVLLLFVISSALGSY